jgi:hypothetical protein
MNQPNDIYLGLSGAEILLSPFGRTYAESATEIARQDRTASGRLVKDIIATKTTFKINYSLISDADLNMLKNIYALDTTLSLKVEKPTGMYSCSVLMSPFDFDRIKATQGGLWAGVALVLEEI